MSSCPKGSRYRLYLGSVLFVGIANFVVLIAVCAYRHYREIQRRDHRAQAESAEQTSLIKGQDMKHDLPKHTRRLVRGVQRAKGALKQMDFEFKDLSMTLPNGTKILNAVTGRLAPGNVTAIMGPSGAGKTTFLSTLMGKVDKAWHSGGELKINGVDAEVTGFKKVVGYVPQDDVMHRELTVWDNIWFSARCRLPPDWSNDEIHLHVRAVVDAMGLSQCADVKIGDQTNRGVSGGQRKRVNIGMELVAAPLALFLDEPTSGLDSTAARDVCTLLKDIARETAITVAMVIHQPRIEIWNALDDCLLLAPGGRTVYQGPQPLCQKYFETHLTMHCGMQENPADVIMDAIADNGENYAQQWKISGKEVMDRMVAQAQTTTSEDAKKAKQAAGEDDDGSSAPLHIRYHVAPEEGKRQEAVEMADVEAGTAASNHADNTKEVRRGSKAHLSIHVNPVGGEQVTTAAGEKRGATFLRQLWLTHTRSLKIQHEKLGALYLESGVAMFAGLMMGIGGGNYHRGILLDPYTLLSGAPIEWFIPQMCMFVNMAIGLSASSAGVKAFGEEQIIYWREAASGHSPLAYFIGNSSGMIYRITLSALHFSFVFHILGKPLISFSEFFPIVWGSFYAVYGLASVISMVLKREDAPLLSVVASLFAAVFGGYVNSLPEFIKKMSYAYWASSAYYTRSVTPFRHLYRIDEISAPIWGYKLDHYASDVVMIFAIGTAFRAIAYVLMVRLNRDKQT